MRAGLKFMLTGAGLGLMLTDASAAQVQRLSGLTALDSGQWELRHQSGAPERICIKDGRQLIQLRHPRQTCESLIVEDEPHDVTVQYTCRGKGYGRTHLRPETARLVQIETQGIEDGLPFNFAVEARWVSKRCAG